jgi:hypothetical protein
MTPDDLFEDTLGDDEDLMADADFYPDSGSDYLDDEDGYEDLLDEDEADYSSGSKRREQTRRASLRRDTPAVKAWARRGKAKEGRGSGKRALNRRAMAEIALQHWRKSIQPEIPVAFREVTGMSMPAWMIAPLTNRYVQTMISLAAPKLADTTSGLDVVFLNARAGISTTITRGLVRSGRISAAEANAVAERTFAKLEPAELILKFVVEHVVLPAAKKKFGLEEADFWDDEDDFAVLDGEGLGDEMAGHISASPAERARCAKALRSGARYLLRLERRLAAGGR